MEISEDMKAQIVTETAQLIAKQHNESILAELGLYIGGAATVPISFAARITGWGVPWIRRNLPIIQAEGQIDSVQLADIKTAIETRKTRQ